MMDWQPFETAPKDGTRILAWGPKEMVITIMWHAIPRRDDGYWKLEPDGGTESNYDIETPLTHWAPLPDPPQ
mgnify:CR=1 FL=1